MKFWRSNCAYLKKLLLQEKDLRMANKYGFPEDKIAIWNGTTCPVLNVLQCKQDRCQNTPDNRLYRARRNELYHGTDGTVAKLLWSVFPPKFPLSSDLVVMHLNMKNVLTRGWESTVKTRVIVRRGNEGNKSRDKKGKLLLKFKWIAIILCNTTVTWQRLQTYLTCLKISSQLW